MDNYDRDNNYDTLIRIFRFVRDYSTSTYTLSRVCNELIRHLRSNGYEVDVIDTEHRDYKIIQVNGYNFKIVRYPAWTRYDVLSVA